MWHLCGVIIEILLSDPQLNFGSILEIHFLFIYEIPIYRTWYLVKVLFFWMDSRVWSRPRPPLTAPYFRPQSPWIKMTMDNPMYGKLEEKVQLKVT